MTYWIGLMAYVITVLLIPPFNRFALKIGFVDCPTRRKTHCRPMPQIGGVVMFLVFFTCFFAVTRTFDRQILGFFSSAVLIFAIGLYDDIQKSKGRELSALPKLIVQVCAASILFFSGVAFTGFTHPLSGQIVVLPALLQYFLTILWVFGITTVINFTDGLDGLAGGVSCIASTTLLIVALLMQDAVPALMSVLLVGILLGYLRFNKPPAKLFMGDSGSTFIGFVLAVISLMGVYKQATVLSLFIPVLVFGVPIFDNLYVVMRRYREGKPLAKADRLQLHYRLIDKGLNNKQVNAFIYLVTACLCLIAIHLFWLNAFIT